MPDDYRISELDSVITITNGDLVELSTVDNNSESGYASVKSTITQLADKILKGIQFATDLDTENKTIIGAINELKVIAGTTAPTAAQGVDGNLYIQYTAGTGGADDVIDGLYIKLDGAWCEISTGGSGSGGHTILDNSGTALTQRANLQFKGAYSEDNSGDDTTEVNVVRSMTKTLYNQLSPDKKVGIINITDEEVTGEDLPISASDNKTIKNYIDDLHTVKTIINGTNGIYLRKIGNMYRLDCIYSRVDYVYNAISQYATQGLQAGFLYITNVGMVFFRMQNGSLSLLSMNNWSALPTTDTSEINGSVTWYENV